MHVAAEDSQHPLTVKPQNEIKNLYQQVSELGEWFHNLDLNGVKTAPNHFLGDFPNIKWQVFQSAIPAQMTGLSVLDIGCNGGFYSLEMKRRGAKRVLGIDIEDRYLNQARFAAQTLNLSIEFEKRSVYTVDEIPGQFDYVFFMGLFYHLRYPLLALDKVVKKVKGTLVFQTMIRGSDKVRRWERNYPISNKQIFLEPDFPAMYFIEKCYCSDPTNWFIPNCAAVEASLRSAGLHIINRPEKETWICVPGNTRREGQYIHDLELAGLL